MKITKRITSVFIALMMVASVIMTMEAEGATQKPKLKKKVLCSKWERVLP